MKLWNVRINDVLIGPISDETITAIRAAIVEHNEYRDPLPIKGPSVSSGKRIEAYWTPGCPISIEEV